MSDQHYILTHSSCKVYPLAPKKSEICFEDIAHALSHICRWTGHCNEFFSVAQHSVYVSSLASPENALWGLLHDASEAYLCDLSRPVKRHPWLANYRLAEENMMRVICEQFDLPTEMPEEIKEIDSRMIATEARDLGFYSFVDEMGFVPYGFKIHPQDPVAAKQSFIEWYSVLSYRGLK